MNSLNFKVKLDKFNVKKKINKILMNIKHLEEKRKKNLY